MKFDENSEIPLYLQVAENIENLIFTKVYHKEQQVMSTTEISSTYKVNPATVLKGMNLLVERNILYKKRGLGLFVCEGAYELILNQRKENFSKDYIEPLIIESKKIGLDIDEVIEWIKRGI